VIQPLTKSGTLNSLNARRAAGDLTIVIATEVILAR
jgi:hypothetical protein